MQNQANKKIESKPRPISNASSSDTGMKPLFSAFFILGS